ncbi:8486_t:CDS:2, partial [Entrophospora sp. SA101]
MEIQLYNGIKHYLTNHQPPRNIPPKLSKQIINKASNFRISNDKLYFIQNNEEQRVVRQDEVERILFGEHSDILAGHFNVESTYQRIRSKYYWPRMYKIVKQYVKSCDSCQRWGKPKRTKALHPIPVGDPFDQVGIDIVGPLAETTNGNCYIIIATEYLTKWPEAHAISDTKARQYHEVDESEVLEKAQNFYIKLNGERYDTRMNNNLETWNEARDRAYFEAQEAVDYLWESTLTYLNNHHNEEYIWQMNESFNNNREAAISRLPTILDLTEDNLCHNCYFPFSNEDLRQTNNRKFLCIRTDMNPEPCWIDPITDEINNIIEEAQEVCEEDFGKEILRHEKNQNQYCKCYAKTHLTEKQKAQTHWTSEPNNMNWESYHRLQNQLQQLEMEILNWEIEITIRPSIPAH